MYSVARRSDILRMDMWMNENAKKIREQEFFPEKERPNYLGPAARNINGQFYVVFNVEKQQWETDRKDIHDTLKGKYVVRNGKTDRYELTDKTPRDKRNRGRADFYIVFNKKNKQYEMKDTDEHNFEGVSDFFSE